jgi:phage gp36-like protein
VPYADQNAIQLAAGGSDRLVELADYDGDGNVDAAVIAEVQAAADGWFDSYFALRYAVPLEAPSRTTVQMAAEECVFRLKRRRGMVTDDDAKAHEERELWLARCSKGQVRPDDPAPAKSSAVKSQIVESESCFSRSSLRGTFS